jgi:hypothetical protein
MKSKILLSTILAATAFGGFAQNANRGFAITGDGNHDFMWMNIKEVNLDKGTITGSVFDRKTTAFTITDAVSKKSYNNQTVYSGTMEAAMAFPTSSFVAAAAYDKRSEKLFFVPMRYGQLRWLDVSSNASAKSFYSIEIPNYTPSTNADENNNITRMVIGADNFGYAVTNDGNHFYKFTTGKKPSITDMGALIDAESNSGLSIHNKCSSWGGDMIADAFGKLYIISAQKSVFSVDVNSRIATYVGHIKGLPAAYTTNGAAVNEAGKVILSSATAFEGYYSVDFKTLEATFIPGSDAQYSAADLASGNLLLQQEADAARAKNIQPIVFCGTNMGGDNAVYPNPVTAGVFNVVLEGKYQGNHNIIISDLAGRALQTVRTNLAKGQVNQRVTLAGAVGKGTYLVTVVDEKGAVILNDKIVVL